MTPVGPYYKGGFKPVKALIVDEYDRAAPLGMGAYKVGANYAAGLLGYEYAHQKGYPIALYLDPKEKKYHRRVRHVKFYRYRRQYIYYA